MKSRLLRIILLAACVGFAAAVWYAGPLVAFADRKPFEPAWVRILVAVAPLLVLIGYSALHLLKIGNHQPPPSENMIGRDDESHMLQARMADAIARLKRSGRGGNLLYELPWYIVIGPPGSGKTTALANSGLNFPLTETPVRPGADNRTASCDWWFAEDAVLIDTAGRFTTQDFDSKQDKTNWLTFLTLLGAHRQKRPIDGVVLTVSIKDLMTLGKEDLAAHIIEIRNRLEEIRERLNIRPPVYVLFTKADLIAGFAEFFSGLDETRRSKVWGYTFPAAESGTDRIGRLSAEYDALARRLAEEVTDRIHEERDIAARIAVFAFPVQFALLKERIVDLLDRVFGQPGEHATADLRGFYLTSGAQEAGSMDKSPPGKGFFLHDLLSEVVFAESRLASRAMQTDGKKALLRYGGLAVVALAVAVPVTVWALSFAENRAIIAATNEAVEQLLATASPALNDAIVSEADLENVIGPLETLRALPAGYETRHRPPSLGEKFGLDQRQQLMSASAAAYGKALERTLRPRLILQLEQTIQGNIADPARLYEPLKIYLMLGGKAPRVDEDLVVAWLEKDWEQNRYPGANNREGREQLKNHLRAMLDLDDPNEPAPALEQQVVEAAQRSLGRMSLAERAAAMIKSATYTASIEDFSVLAHAGPDAPLVFETTNGTDLSTLRVPGLYTYAGFNDFYLGQLATIAQELTDDAWVIGAGGEQGGAAQDQLRLGPELLDIYGKDFVTAWTDVLSRLKFKKMSEGKPQYIALSAAALPTSPIKQLFEAIASETALTREADGVVSPATDSADRTSGLAKIGVELASRKSQSRAGGVFANPGGQTPGANVEAQFKPFQLLVSGAAGQRPIDSLVRNFHDIYQTLLLAAAVPTQTERANANLQLQISTLRANASRLPVSLAGMVRATADDFEGEAAETSLAKLDQMLADTVGKPCQEAIANRYPFAGGSPDDVPMADFATMFAPNGVIDRFFTQYLAPLADLSGQTWQWKQDTRLGRTLSRAALRSFQQATEIRDAFFQPGSTMLAVQIAIEPSTLHGDVDMALLDINGQVVQSYQTGNTPSEVSWPQAAGSGSASISLTPDLPGRQSAIRFEGPWALKRLLEAGSITRNGDKTDVRFVIGGRDVAYSIGAGAGPSPFQLPALSGFSCPTSLR